MRDTMESLSLVPVQKLQVYTRIWWNEKSLCRRTNPESKSATNDASSGIGRKYGKKEDKDGDGKTEEIHS